VRDWLVLAVATLWMLGCAEGRVALPGGGEGRAAVGERVADGAQSVVQRPSARAAAVHHDIDLISSGFPLSRL
jgi:broad specificity phosphatase PhoE